MEGAVRIAEIRRLRCKPMPLAFLHLPVLELPGHAAHRVKLVCSHFARPGRSELEFELHFLMLDHVPANDAGAPTPGPAENASRKSRWQLANLKRFANFRSKSGQVSHENSRLVLTLIKQPPLGVPDLKTFVVKPNRSPVTRRDSHCHPFSRRDGLSTTVAGLPAALPMAELDQVNSWKTALLNSLSNELTTDAGVHRTERQDATVLLPQKIERNPYRSHQGLTRRGLGPRLGRARAR